MPGQLEGKAAFIPSAISTFSGLQGLQKNEQAMEIEALKSKTAQIELETHQIKLNEEKKRHEFLSKPRQIDEYLLGLGFDSNSDTYKVFEETYKGLSQDGKTITGYDVENVKKYATTTQEFGMKVLNARAKDAERSFTKASEALDIYMQEKMRPGATIDNDPKYAQLVEDMQMAGRVRDDAKAKVFGAEKGYLEMEKMRRLEMAAYEKMILEMKKKMYEQEIRMAEIKGRLDVAGINAASREKVAEGKGGGEGTKTQQGIEKQIDKFFDTDPELAPYKNRADVRTALKHIIENKDQPVLKAVKQLKKDLLKSSKKEGAPGEKPVEGVPTGNMWTDQMNKGGS